jgi:hypothetical protein
MNLLTDDMSMAIDSTELASGDMEIIKAILYQERQNKERTWDSDAEKYIAKLIDENASGVSAI